jgi:plasmid stabilization system protein ParE
VKLLYKGTYFDDLDDIEVYIATCFNEGLAHDTVQKIHSKCIVVADQPYIGRVYPRNPFFRCLNVERKNVLFYHIDEDAQTVTLHRIFDTRRDYSAAVSSILEE